MSMAGKPPGGVERSLSECLFSQYMATVGAIAGTTAYTLAKRPKNGMALLLAGGAAGTLADALYGWFVACEPERRSFVAQREQEYWQRENVKKQRQIHQERHYDAVVMAQQRTKEEQQQQEQQK